jgi:hypothetical protein
MVMRNLFREDCMADLNTITPLALEQQYQAARRSGDEAAFRARISTLATQMPDDELLAAWQLRFAAGPLSGTRSGINWRLALPLSLLSGLLVWLIAQQEWWTVGGSAPALLYWYAPIGAAAGLALLALSTRSGYRRNALLALLLLGLAALLTRPQAEVVAGSIAEQPLLLAFLHLPLLAWGALGYAALNGRQRHDERFAVLAVSLEIIIGAGLLAIVSALFFGITYGMLGTLGIELPEAVNTLLLAGGAGMLPVLALVLSYDPARSPAEQAGRQPLSRFISRLLQVMLWPTAVVLLGYLIAIAVAWQAAFEQRDILIVYNVMLFAVVALLLATTPLQGDGDESAQRRLGILRGLIAGAAALVGLYALAAVSYRSGAGLTPNRLSVIGWNAINIVLLIGLAVEQLRRRADWIIAQQRLFNLAALAYLIWGAVVVVVLPFIW